MYFFFRIFLHLILTNWLFIYCLISSLSQAVCGHLAKISMRLFRIGKFLSMKQIWWPWRRCFFCVSNFELSLTSFQNYRSIPIEHSEHSNVAFFHFYCMKYLPFSMEVAMKSTQKFAYFCVVFCFCSLLLLLVLLLIDRMINVFNSMHFLWVWIVDSSRSNLIL